MTNTFTIGLLATAVSASLAMANGGEGENKFQDKSPVSFKAGSGVTFDGGDNFSLNLKNRLQIQFSHTFGDGLEAGEDNNTTSFDIRRARTSLSGHAFDKNIQYMLNMDWTDGDSLDGDTLVSNSVLKDAWAQWNFVSNDTGKVGVRIGQSKTYYGLEGTGTSAGLYFVERSDAAEFFSNARSRGAWLHGNHMESKLRWTAGAQNNGVSGGVDASEEGSNPDNELVYVFSANFDPMGDFVGGGSSYEKYMQGDLDGAAELKGTVGLGYAIDNREEDAESTNFNLNTAWKVSNFWAQLEYFGRTDDTGATEYDHDGLTLAAGYTLPKSGDSNMQWGLGARWSSRKPDDAFADANEIEELTVGINAFYHGHNCKTQINFVNTDDKTTDLDEQAIVIQFQIII